MTTPAQIDWTARDFQSVSDALDAHVAVTRPGDVDAFLNTELGRALIEMVAYTSDVTSYAQDLAAHEYFPTTARRLGSLLRMARSIGYVPVAAVAATVTVVVQDVPLALSTAGGSIAAGTFVSGDNGLNYEVKEHVTVPAGTTSLSLVLHQGQNRMETFVPTSEMSQEFRMAFGTTEQGSWNVYIGPISEANLWTQVNDVRLEASATRTYAVFIDADGRLNVRFGDKSAGKIPDDTLTVTYRTTDGAAGNAAIGTVKGTIKATVTGGGAVSLSVLNSAAASTGGVDRESAASLRDTIPAFIRTVDRATTIQDYADLVKPQVALSFVDVAQADFGGNVVRVNVWGEVEVDFTVVSGVTTISSTVKYKKFAQVGSGIANVLQQILVPRTLLTVHNVITRPTVASVDLYFSPVHYDLLRPRADVHREIVQAVVDVFQDGPGFVVRLADLYDAVRSVNGVRYFTVTRAVFNHIDWVTGDPLVTVSDDYRVDMDPQGDDGGPFLPMQDITVPGAIARAWYDDAFLYTNELNYDTAAAAAAVQAINLGSLNFDLQS